MSWVIDQVKIAGDYSGTAGTTGSITLTSVGAGHNLAVFIQNGNTNAYTFSDNIGGNTYVNVDAVFNANNQQLASFYVLNASGGITSITITDTTANELIFWSLAVIEFHWSGGGTPTAHGHNSATGTGTALSSGAAAFTSGDLTVGAACTGGAGSNIVAGSGFTQQNNSTTFEYSDETGTTSGTATFTIAASDNWACDALTFTPPPTVFIPRKRRPKKSVRHTPVRRRRPKTAVYI